MSSTVLSGGFVLSADGSRFERGDLLVVDDRIARIGAGLEADAVIDVADRFVIPGLIDSHYHLVSRSDTRMSVEQISASMIEGVINAGHCVASGVTSVRDCGCRHEGIYAMRAAIASGMIAGPVPFVAGRNPTGTSAPAHWRNVVVDGPESMRAAVRGLHESGAQWVKIILSHTEDPLDWSNVIEYLDDAEIAAAVDEAHRLGLHLGAHCEGWDVAERAVRLGLDSLEHAPLVSQQTAERMAARGMFYTPTVWAFSDDSGVDESELTAAQADALAGWRAEHRASVARAHAAGVRIAAGSDSADVLTGTGVLAREMHALSACGLSAVEVLRAATATGAALQGRTDVGRLASGLLADLVVLDRDPFETLDAVGDPRLVITRGRVAFDRVRGLVGIAPQVAEEKVLVRRWA